MSGVEFTAYGVTGVLLGASCALFLLAWRSVPTASRLAPWVATLSCVTLGTGLGCRGVGSGRWPLGTPFEFTLGFAACLVLVYLCLRPVARQPAAGAAATLLALALVLQALFSQPGAERAIPTLPPVMRGLWFTLHTLLTAVAYGALATAGAGALVALTAAARDGDGAGRMHTLVDWAMGIGYVALSVGMIAGAVWGEQAWGEYWTWSIKEAWTLLTWLVCIFYFHVRHRRGWRGPPAMSIAVLSLVAVMVTFFFTPTLLHWTRLQPLRLY